MLGRQGKGMQRLLFSIVMRQDARTWPREEWARNSIMQGGKHGHGSQWNRRICGEPTQQCARYSRAGSWYTYKLNTARSSFLYTLPYCAISSLPSYCITLPYFVPERQTWMDITCYEIGLTQQVTQGTARLRARLQCLSSRCTRSRRSRSRSSP